MTDESQISERELQILYLVAKGATNQQIAQELNISINTVKVHLRNIFGKIGVVSRTEATVYAVRAGWISMERIDGTTVVAEAPEEAPSVEDRALSDDAPDHAAPDAPAAVAPPLPAVATPSELVAPPSVPSAPPTRLNPLILALAAIVLLLVGGGIATLLRQPAAELGAPTSAAESALPNTDQRWRTLEPMPAPRAAFALAPSSFDGASHLFVIGGDGASGVSSDVLRYDIAADSWARYTAKPTPVADARAVVIGGRIFVPGGRLEGGAISTAFEAYDPQSDTWSTRAPLPAPRSRYALAAVEGKLYLFGGWDGADYTDQVWQYSPDTDSWAVLKAMPAARADADAAVIDGQVFLVGGENATGTLTRLDRYNPSEEAQGSPWAVRAPLLDARSRLAVVATSGRLFAFGGPAGALSYQASRDAWEEVALPAELVLSDLRAAFVGETQVYILGGRSAAGPSDVAFEYQAIYLITLPATQR